MITLDGSQGEGGGQILRTGLALSMVTGRPVRFHHIRAKRPKPGLMRQHLTCVLAAQAVSGAQVSGAALGSLALDFTPGPVRGGEHSFAVGSAGSCLLVLQTVLPALMLTVEPSSIQLSGGTHNPMAPPFHFLQRTLAPLLAQMGVGLELTLQRCGFYPAGGGQVHARITPAPQLRAFDLMQRGELLSQRVECMAPALERHVAPRELHTARTALGWPEDAFVDLRVPQDHGPGNVLMATLEHEHITEHLVSFGASGLGSEAVAQRLVKAIRAYKTSDAPVGEHLADQWSLLLALAVARSEAESFSGVSERRPKTCPIKAQSTAIARLWRAFATPSGCVLGW